MLHKSYQNSGYGEVEKDGPEEKVQAHAHEKSIFRVEVYDPDTIRFRATDQLQISDDKDARNKRKKSVEK